MLPSTAAWGQPLNSKNFKGDYATAVGTLCINILEHSANNQQPIHAQDNTAKTKPQGFCYSAPLLSNEEFHFNFI